MAVESTADIDAVSHVNKWGESMPIIRSVPQYPGLYRVEHEGTHVGYLSKIPRASAHGTGLEHEWLSHHPPSEAKPRGHMEAHQTKHEAVDFLFGPPGDAPD